MAYSSDRYYHFPRTEQLVLDSSGLPVFLETTGRIRDGVHWYERFEGNDSTARWSTPSKRGEVAGADRAFYASVYPAHDHGVLARALLRRPSRTLPLLPEGEAWLEAVANQRRQIARVVAPPERTHPLVIRGARLFDSEAGEVREGITIVVEGERIAAVAPDGAVEIPTDAEVIDARKRMVLPGLWDMHAHLSIPAAANSRGAALLHLAGGVTTVRAGGRLNA